MLFPPRVFLVVDEERYVSQAVAFAHGSRTIPGAEILSARTATVALSDFPPGTSLLQTPFVWVGGWRAAALLSVLALIVATLITMRWLKENERPPTFALLIPGFFGALFFGRIGMSDLPATALVALAMWLVFRTRPGDAWGSLLAGFCAGGIVLFREAPVLLVAPVALGALLRGRCVRLALVVGGVGGIATRFIAYRMLVGAALHLRDSGYGFSLNGAVHGLPIYAAILLVMLPAGALLPALYQGPRRPELIAGVAVYVALFVFYDYDAIGENGPFKGIVLASRYMVPALPVFAFMAADVAPRVVARLALSRQNALLALARIAAAAVVAMAFVVHPLARRQERTPLAIVKAIYGTTKASIPVVTNTRATLKYLSPSYEPRRLIPTYAVSGDSLAGLGRRFGTFSMALLDRNDSQMFRQESDDNARLLAEVRQRCTARPVHDAPYGGWARLRVFDISNCR